MNIVFAGTPEFAAIAYRAIVQAGFNVPMVLTQPDRPAGRGMKLTPSAVKVQALQFGAEVWQPHSLKLEGPYGQEAQQVQQQLQALQPDVMVVAAYGLLLPQWVLDLPTYGCLNIHASLLPRWRGAAPIHRAIEAGDEYSGVGIMQMQRGLDTGPILLEKKCAVAQNTTGQLHDRLAALGAEAIVEVLGQLGQAPLAAQPQDESQVTYAHKITKQEARLDWQQTASELARKIRAFNPFPGATLPLPGLPDPIKVWQAEVLDSESQRGAIGEILAVSAAGIDVQSAQGVLRLLELQKPGGKRQSVSRFIQGWNAKQSST
ncbi:methionyl-tRNA formyltransferase [Brackiella oedipodis]|uniref:methionyl-tRNA formyltransferase n=1 Tax=Brackiella oedipodis TaxID=124225 RepID=UPI00048D34FC|nr:methionyl-tRNA formyltransferase [Brackiella oedipodis]